jgi:glycosyltransferase involved in cell wall biosynthesis
MSTPASFESEIGLNSEPEAISCSKSARRVWALSELYYPEVTSTGYFMTGAAEGLAPFCNVSVICGQPSYQQRGIRVPPRELRNGVDIYRCWSTTLDKDKLGYRLLNLLTISGSVFVTALLHVRRGDIVISVTNPPLLPYLAAIACKMRGGRFILLVHDVYPEVLTRLKILKTGSLAGRMLSRACRWLYRAAERIVVLGRDMRDLVESKLDKDPGRITIIPNWGDTDSIQPTPISGNRLLESMGLTNRFVVQYCGNIGRTHGIEDILSAAEILTHDRSIHFLLIGWGAKKEWAIQRQAERGLRNLTILDPLSPEDLCEGLNACSVSIISLTRGMAGISVPSRTYNVLASGKPIVAVCDAEAELASVVREERVGWVIPPGRPEAIAASLLEAKANPALLIQMGRRARLAAQSKYTMTKVVEQYKTVIEGMNNK